MLFIITYLEDAAVGSVQHVVLIGQHGLMHLVPGKIEHRVHVHDGGHVGVDGFDSLQGVDNDFLLIAIGRS